MQRIPEKPIKRFRAISSSKSLEVSGVQIPKECIWAIHLLEWPKPETLITPMLARSKMVPPLWKTVWQFLTKLSHSNQ
jgi:hypothetical protein